MSNESNVSINPVNASTMDVTNVPNVSIVNALVSELAKTALALNMTGADTLPYTIIRNDDFVTVGINPNCRNNDSKKTCRGYLEAFVAGKLAVKVGDTYEFLGDSTYTPHTLLAEFIRLESNVRDAKKTDKKNRRDKEARIVESATTILNAFNATERDKLITAYHNGEMSADDLKAAMSKLNA